MSRPSPPAPLGIPPATRVVPVRQLAQQSRTLHGPLRVVIDAVDQAPTPRTLALLLVMRRRIRATGGDLLLAGGHETAELLRRHGLQWTLTCHRSAEEAAEAPAPPARESRLASRS